MKYLLLGGSGFIGAHLASVLSKKHDVTVIGYGPSFDLKNVTYHQLDFVNCHDFSEYINDIDVVVHLVSTIIPSDNLSNINQEIADNVFPTTILLDNAARLHKKIIFISSGGTVYGENKQPNSEQTPTNPICNYGVSKLLIEKYLYLYHHFYDLDYRIVRLSNPYSEKIYHGKKQGVIPIIIDNIINQNTIDIWGKKQVRDYIHIDDAINGIVAVLDYQGAERIFNIGSGEGHTVEDVINITEAKLGQTAHIKYLPRRKCDVETNVLDISLIKQKTGWSPKISLSEGINKIIRSKQE